MPIEIYALQIALGVLLFFIINMIGKHSYSIGYMQISMFLKEEEAPAFNFLYRIISPVVFLFICSALLYKFGMDRFTKNFYLVSIYYLAFRLVFNVLTNRTVLMNWFRQVLYWISICILSYFSYIEIISKKENILPDFSTISNELWIIILIFLFHTMNRIRLSSDKTIERKKKYLSNRFKRFRQKYGRIIDEKIHNHKLKSIAYAIMIYEDFNRPRITRFIENVSFYITKNEHSLGLMQVQTITYINDRESVELGLEKISNAYLKALKKRGLHKEKSIKLLMSDAWQNEGSLERMIVKDYNPDDPYISEVLMLTEKIFQTYMPANKTYLFPGYDGADPWA